MRIGIDMFGVQSPGSRDRGVGRLGRGLVKHLLAAEPSHQYLLYAHEGFSTDTFPTAPHAEVRTLRRDPARNETQLAHVMERLAREDPDELDILLLLNPFELDEAYGPPARPLHGPRLVALMHDVIPFRFQEHYLKPEAYGRRMYRHLERLRRYDLLLANSEATRLDVLDLLGLPADRVITVGAACEPEGLTPRTPGPIGDVDRAVLEALGINRPFVFCLGGIDCADRKNWAGLVEGFSLLPPELIDAHQLVLACAMTDDDRRLVHERAFAQGIGNRLLLPGAVPDSTLRLLYQHCSAFAFPSRYEGFGLPLLEALHCGAPVLAGANSSQPDVIGDSGLLVNVNSTTEIASGLARLLSDAPLAALLRAKGPARASTFTLSGMAKATAAALATLPGRVPPRKGAKHLPSHWRDLARLNSTSTSTLANAPPRRPLVFRIQEATRLQPLGLGTGHDSRRATASRVDVAGPTGFQANSPTQAVTAVAELDDPIVSDTHDPRPRQPAPPRSTSLGALPC